MNEQKIKSFYTYLQSQQTAQSYLYHCYKEENEEHAEKKSYENCQSFIYYLDHGLHFYEVGKTVETKVKPILLFYGMIHLLKALILTKRPNYPESTKVLAHGVSTRKRKKREFSFLKDEVKAQHHGLFRYFSEHLFNMKELPADKFNMGSLLALIPEIHLLFKFNNADQLIIIGNTSQPVLFFPNQLLDSYSLTANSFVQRLSRYLPTLKQALIKPDMIEMKLSVPVSESIGPFFIHMADQTIYFPTHREQFLHISEVMVHYLILYNLSMLSRYETEWWGDLLQSKAEIDYPIITSFLATTSEKIPILIGEKMYQKWPIDV